MLLIEITTTGTLTGTTTTTGTYRKDQTGRLIDLVPVMEEMQRPVKEEQRITRFPLRAKEITEAGTEKQGKEETSKGGISNARTRKEEWSALNNLPGLITIIPIAGRQEANPGHSGHPQNNAGRGRHSSRGSLSGGKQIVIREVMEEIVVEIMEMAVEGEEEGDIEYGKNTQHSIFNVQVLHYSLRAEMNVVKSRI
jgi:hypothetical protein